MRRHPCALCEGVGAPVVPVAGYKLGPRKGRSEGGFDHGIIRVAKQDLGPAGAGGFAGKGGYTTAHCAGQFLKLDQQAPGKFGRHIFIGPDAGGVARAGDAPPREDLAPGRGAVVHVVRQGHAVDQPGSWAVAGHLGGIRLQRDDGGVVFGHVIGRGQVEAAVAEMAVAGDGGAGGPVDAKALGKGDHLGMIGPDSAAAIFDRTAGLAPVARMGAATKAGAGLDDRGAVAVAGQPERSERLPRPARYRGSGCRSCRHCGGGLAGCPGRKGGILWAFGGAPGDRGWPFCC